MAPKQTQRTPCTIYSRVNGWYAPTSAYNPGKIAEFGDRKGYKPFSKNQA